MENNKEEIAKKGDILHYSWGYDMTINEYCIVLESTGKTLKCQMIGTTLIEGDAQLGTVVPNPSHREGKPFRLRVKYWEKYGDYSYNGSFPYVVQSDGRESKQMGYFSKWDGTPDRENHMD